MGDKTGSDLEDNDLDFLEESIDPPGTTLKPQRGFTMNFLQFQSLMVFLCSKKRHEFPTKRAKQTKKAHIQADLDSLATSFGLQLTDRQYIEISKKVKQSSVLFQQNINHPLDNLKKLFGFPNKLLSDSSATQSSMMRI
jgi:ribosomal protein L9